ncbi:MAG: acyl carrier protein [Rikenellaceae bacterium]
MKELEYKVIGIVAEHLGFEQSRITLASNFVDDLGADSLDIVELVMAIEEEYGVEISDEDAEKMLTVGDVVFYLENSGC